MLSDACLLLDNLFVPHAKFWHLRCVISPCRGILRWHDISLQIHQSNNYARVLSHFRIVVILNLNICNTGLPLTSQHGDTKTRLHSIPALPHQDWCGSNVSVRRLGCTNETDLRSTAKNPDDVVITLAIRTPLAKGNKGGFKDTELDYIIYALLKKVLEKSKIDPQLVEDVCLGNVRQSQDDVDKF